MTSPSLTLQNMQTKIQEMGNIIETIKNKKPDDINIESTINVLKANLQEALNTINILSDNYKPSEIYGNSLIEDMKKNDNKYFYKEDINIKITELLKKEYDMLKFLSNNNIEIIKNKIQIKINEITDAELKENIKKSINLVDSTINII